jgi:arachidonate 15-lipoxygenase
MMKPSLMPSLPQNDPVPPARSASLDAKRSDYRWDHDYLPPLALSHVRGGTNASSLKALVGWTHLLPRGTAPGEHYLEGRASSLAVLALNDKEAELFSRRDTYSSLSDYDKLFQVLVRPRVIETWQEDAEFAWQRLAGPSPCVIRRITEVPGGFAITDERLAGLLREGQTLAGKAKAGELYLCDYSILEDVPSASDAAGTRHTMPALALFHVEGGALRPLAIQLGLDPDPRRVYTPKDGKAWLVAKVCVQSADVNYHEMGPHLVRTHFLEETFCVATERQLAQNHPISVLLTPHFNTLIFNNFEGRELLINPGGKVDQSLGGGVAGSKTIIARDVSGYPKRGVPGWTFESWDLPADIAARDVGDLPDYAYRDDGLLIWNAIHAFVTDYLALYYTSDEDVVQDWEVQRWVAELAAPDGGRVPKMPGAIAKVKELATILTRIIFTCGPQHASVNFAQYEYIAFAPNMPLALYAPVPADMRSLSEAQLDELLLRILPPPAKTTFQLDTIVELTSFRYLRLGRYPDGTFRDPATVRVIASFQKALDAAEDEIKRRNADRRRRGIASYTYFIPSLLPVSTSI